MKYFKFVFNLFEKIAFSYLIFIIFCFVGCIYHVVQISQVYFSFHTKVDVQVDLSNQITVPMVSLCKSTYQSMKNITDQVTLTPKFVFDQTYDFDETFFKCKLRLNDTDSIEASNCSDLISSGVQHEKTVNDRYICYHIKHPQFSNAISRQQGILFMLNFYHFNGSESWLYFSSLNNTPSGLSWNSFKILSGRHYVISYSRRITYLLPPPYTTQCFDYSKIGFKSRNDCYEKCYIELSVRQCNVVPSYININGKFILVKFNQTDQEKLCIKQVERNICHRKCHHDDCVNEYYTFKLITDNEIDDKERLILTNEYPNLNYESVSVVEVASTDEPDTIYRHSPEQQLVEFICYTAGVISLWTGFSILSVYHFGKKFYQNRQNRKQKKEKIFNFRQIINQDNLLFWRNQRNPAVVSSNSFQSNRKRIPMNQGQNYFRRNFTSYL